MFEQQKAVEEFHKAAGHQIPKKPTTPEAGLAMLRHNLIAEELEELDTAMGLDKDLNYDLNNVNLIEIADAIGDLLYVVYGTAVDMGIDIEPIWNEIHRSNMSKFIDGHRREDGKWMKGPSYSPANLTPLIQEQLHNESLD